MDKFTSSLIWPEPQEVRVRRPGLAAEGGVRPILSGDADWLRTEAANVVRLIEHAAPGIVQPNGGVPLILSDMDTMARFSRMCPVVEREGYVLEISPRRLSLAGRDAAGLFWGAQTLVQILAPFPCCSRVLRTGGTLPGLVIRDWPRYPLRGAHMYLPARAQLDFFWRFLDYLAACKYNVLILEIGGGMEYERHPEINRAWKRFCREADNYDPTGRADVLRFKQRHPRGANALSNSRWYWKDSTHTELAGGEWLTKDEVRRIADECARRHIEIIPEVQSLSHSYYLCVAHPEIAERCDDPWPDTYCPSNPKSYELVFDVMEEVIEVLHPRIMSVGHDELYHLGICPRCRKRSGHDLLAGDLNRLHRFLAERGLRMMMWGDTLMNFTDAEGRRCGGVRRVENDPWTGRAWVIPATYKAAERVPKDILIADWYWSLDPKSERYFHRHGFEVMYGNFSPLGFRDWEKRAGVPYVLGAEVSSWCEVSAYAFGHNRVLHDLFAAAGMLWRGRQVERAELAPRMARAVCTEVDRLTGMRRWLVSGGRGHAQPIELSSAATPLSEFLASQARAPKVTRTMLGTGEFRLLTDERGFLARAIVLGKSNPKSHPVLVGRKASKVLVLHGSTMQDVFFQPTFYSYHRGPAELLRYRVVYADGKTATFSAHFGDEIGPVAGAWPSKPGGACFRAVPVALDGEHTLYAQEWDNPRPTVPIARIVVTVGKDAVEKGDLVIVAISIVE